MKADEATRAAIVAQLMAFGDAYRRRDPAALLALFAADADVVFIGTGVDERRVGPDELKAQIERDVAQSDAVSFDWDWHAVSQAGPVAWIAAHGIVAATVDGRDITFPIRLTGILEQRDSAWLFLHTHLSVPATAEPEGHSFPEFSWY